MSYSSNSLRPQPFIGISGLAHAGDQAVIARLAERHLSHTGRFVMLGVMANDATQLQNQPSSQGPDWYPVGDAISSAAAPDASDRLQPFVHLDDQLLRHGADIILQRTGHYIRGVQINMLPWMTVDYTAPIAALRSRRPDIAVVLQAHEGILTYYSPDQVAERIRDLPIDYLLLDTSRSRGIAFDPSHFSPYVDAIYQRQLPVGVVVAGGLEAGNVEQLLGPLFSIYPDLSCDAAGRLRRGERGSTQLHSPAVNDYFIACCGLLTAPPKLIANSPTSLRRFGAMRNYS